MADKPKIFVDSSVLIAAVLSQEGASSFIFSIGEKGLIDLIITTNVVKEATNALVRKYESEETAKLVELIARFKDSVQYKVEENLDEELLNLVNDPKDLHIVRGAMKHQVDFLVTLDRRHLLTEKLHGAGLPFKILLPGEFLKDFRKNLEK